MDRDAAVAALYEREYEKLCRAAYLSLGDREAAEDLVQDTFLLALLKREEFPQGHPAPEAWLTVTLRNLIRNERRKLVSHGAVPLDDAAELPAAVPAPSLAEALPAGLSEADRNLLLWRFEQQRGYREIAAALATSEGAARVRVFRAVEKCKKLL